MKILWFWQVIPPVTAILLSLIFLPASGSAQTVGYADAIEQMGKACRADIAKYCKTVQLGGGRMQRCLNQAGVSAGCKQTITALVTLVKKRAEARNAIRKICDSDIRQFCGGVQEGDGNLLACFEQTKQRVSAKCRQAVVDAGYDTKLSPGQSTDQVALNPDKIVQGLHTDAATVIDVPKLKQIVLAGMKDPARANRVNREPIVDQLNGLAQFTIAIEFDFNSARIKPDSFRAVGLMADALNSPYLQGYRFVIVGHTDGTGSREYNLKLSEERAAVIREALINPFGISPKRLESIGFGEEQFLNRATPAAAENRRVQLINIGN